MNIKIQINNYYLKLKSRVVHDSSFFLSLNSSVVSHVGAIFQIYPKFIFSIIS